MKTKLHLFVTLLALSALSTELSTALAQGTTAFTYQGLLNSGTTAANGSYDMTFAIYNAAVSGTLIAGPITNTAVAVSNGLFTATLNFGPGVFTGSNYWVQIAVSPAGLGTFTTLTPLQQLTPAPYALSLVAPQANALCPAGSIMAFGGPTNNIPTGWLFCNGFAVSRTNYASLFAAIGTAWGAGDGTNTFNLPNMQGVFLRGVDNGVGMDPDTNMRGYSASGANSGDAVGSYQADAFQAHSHTLPWGYGFFSPPGGPYQMGIANAGFNGFQTTSAGTSSETRPKNVYVNYIIKY